MQQQGGGHLIDDLPALQPALTALTDSVAGVVQQGVGIAGGEALVEEVDGKAGMRGEESGLEAVDELPHSGSLGAGGSVGVQGKADDEGLYLVLADEARNRFDVCTKAGAMECKERLRGEAQRIRNGQTDAAVAYVQCEGTGMGHEGLRISCASTVYSRLPAVHRAAWRRVFRIMEF